MAAVGSISATPASAQGWPSFANKVRVNDGSGVLINSVKRDVRASVRTKGNATAKATVTLRGPASGTGTRSRTWTLYGQSPLVNQTRRFPLARMKTTVSFTLEQRAYTEKIWSYNFDAYFNICVKGLKDVTASGGNLYCEVYHPSRVRYRQTTKQLRTYPRPKLLNSERVWINPLCVVGETRLDTSSFTEDVNQTCQDGALETNPNPIEGCDRWDTTYPQLVTQTELIPQLSGKTRRVVSTRRDCEPSVKGPGWVTSSVVPLPAPTVTITSLTPGALTSYYEVAGTAVNNYRGTCWIDVFVVNTDGVAHKAASIIAAAPGVAQEWRVYYWEVSRLGTPTTSAYGERWSTCR